MKKLYCLIVLSTISFSLPACAPYPNYPAYSSQPSVYAQKSYSVDTSMGEYSDKNFSILLAPVKEDDAYRAFRLIVTNKTKDELKIVWNDTYFLEGENANGGFMFEGIQYAQRNAPKQDMLILPNSFVAKIIYPTEKVVYLNYDVTAARMGLPSGWVHGVMENANFGAYVKVKGKNFEKSVKLSISIQVVP